ncbi:MAG: zinc dependent phospholipase C family protein [Planctomycetota bacterium]
MPANIAHMLIAHKALQKLQEKKVVHYTQFAKKLDQRSDGKNFRAYVNQGSIGPDLFYYTSLARAAKDMVVDGYVQAAGPVPWSYHMHSQRPNQFPLSLVEIVFRDADRRKSRIVLEDDDMRKLAFIAGYLTHIAADQIIHPLVNNVAGPYYRKGDFRKTHRECEVFQDYFLYEEVYRLEEKQDADHVFMDQDFRGWADCVPGLTFKNTRDWFRYMLQRGLAETYGSFPPEDDIEDAVDNLLFTLRVCKTLGPYRKAANEYRNKDTSKLFREYVTDVRYVRHYRLAVELSVVYLIALYEVYRRLRDGLELNDAHRARFLSIVQGADLSCPLQQDILNSARSALADTGTMDAFLRESTEEPLTRVRDRLLSADYILDPSKDIAAVATA